MRASVRRTALGTGLALAISATAVLAAGVSLDLAPGLWEFSIAGSASGVPVIPPEAMVRMKPEQRLMLQAMLIALIAQANTPHTVRMCITPDQLRAGFDPNRLSYPGCRHHMGSGLTDHLDMEVECVGKEPLDARLRLDAINQRAVEGNLKVDAGRGPDRLSVRQSVDGRWLGRDCGDTPPLG
jgi:Protein of unknown function (DUF3617)